MFCFGTIFSGHPLSSWEKMGSWRITLLLGRGRNVNRKRMNEGNFMVDIERSIYFYREGVDNGVVRMRLITEGNTLIASNGENE